MKFAKTIRFDKSDLNVFENASGEAEWAISGAFEFSNDLNENLTGKRKQSFANGFLGLDTFGRSTLVSIVSIDESKKFQDEIQKLTDSSIKEIENLTISKESEILKV